MRGIGVHVCHQCGDVCGTLGDHLDHVEACDGTKDCDYQEPHKHGFACDKTCECEGR